MGEGGGTEVGGAAEGAGWQSGGRLGGKAAGKLRVGGGTAGWWGCGAAGRISFNVGA